MFSWKFQSWKKAGNIIRLTIATNNNTNRMHVHKINKTKFKRNVCVCVFNACGVCVFIMRKCDKIGARLVT